MKSMNLKKRHETIMNNQNSELMRQTALAEHWRNKYIAQREWDKARNGGDKRYETVGWGDQARNGGNSAHRDSAVLAFIAGSLMGATIAAWWLS